MAGELNLSSDGSVLLDDDGNVVPGDVACCCAYRRAKDPCGGDAYVDAWMKVGDIPADYMNCGGTCYKLAAGQTEVESIYDVPPGDAILDPGDCVATTSADLDCCPPFDCSTFEAPDDLNENCVVAFDVRSRTGGEGQPCTIRCEGRIFVTLRPPTGDVAPFVRWESNASINLCTPEGSSSPDVSGKITLNAFYFPDDPDPDKQCGWELVFNGDLPGCTIRFRRYLQATPYGGYDIAAYNDTPTNPAAQAAYDCPTSGRGNCGMALDGIRNVTVS
jgi:hypothetical protein